MIAAPTQFRSREQVEEFRERTARKLHDLRCPVHGQTPRLRFQGSTLRDVTIRMSGCCDTLLSLANQKIAGQA
ncbi:MAG: hypothetical protein M3O20_05145 [Acidobacteriota bacterium]|nr:hypothetical protein [Acidobacteriota bacterium]